MKTLLISGGSASGKTWLTHRLMDRLGEATLLSQDAFYHDRPSGSAADRHEFDFDQPYAIDWVSMQAALLTLQAGQATDIPVYDFNVSLRSGSERLELTGKTLIVEGTLVLSRPDIFNLADCKVFVRCPEALRRARRERRDVEERGRKIEFVRQQLAEQVFPAHDTYVEPSAEQADLILQAEDIVSDPDRAVTEVLALLEKTG